MKIKTKPKIRTSIPDFLEENGISPSKFADTVSSFGGGRTAAYKLVRGETNVSANTMLIAAHVLEESVDALFWIEYDDDVLYI